LSISGNGYGISFYRQLKYIYKMNTLFNSKDYTQMLERISKLNSSSAPLWGKMTVNQMVCHLSDPFRDFLKIRITSPVVPFFLRPLFKMMLLGKSPFGKNSPTVKPYLQSIKGGGTKPKSFDSDLSELKNLLYKFASLDSKTELGNHGALGLLNQEQAGIFMWKHLDHHLRQFGV
jgi:hypothetical protein